MRDLYAILGLSDDGRTLHVEPGATVGEVTAWLLSRELQLECTLEMADATLGGLAMATGMTTHSHICSLIHETIVEYEIVTASGDIVLARDDNEHADLWRALPWSHGTLGLLTSLKLRVIPASPWVQLTYTPYASAAELGVAYRAVLAQAERRDPETPFFVEAIVFDRERSVLMTGKLGMDTTPVVHFFKPKTLLSVIQTCVCIGAHARVCGVVCLWWWCVGPGARGEDGAEETAALVHEAPQNRIGLWYKPWFYKHVETKLERLTLPTAVRSTTECIPVRTDVSGDSARVELLSLKYQRLVHLGNWVFPYSPL
jgi:hypothetical protein